MTTKTQNILVFSGIGLVVLVSVIVAVNVTKQTTNLVGQNETLAGQKAEAEKELNDTYLGMSDDELWAMWGLG